MPDTSAVLDARLRLVNAQFAAANALHGHQSAIDKAAEELAALEKAAAEPKPPGVRVYRVDADAPVRSRDYPRAHRWDGSHDQRLFVFAADGLKIAEFAPGRWTNVEHLAASRG